MEVKDGNCFISSPLTFSPGVSQRQRYHPMLSIRMLARWKSSSLPTILPKNPAIYANNQRQLSMIDICKYTMIRVLLVIPAGFWPTKRVQRFWGTRFPRLSSMGRGVRRAVMRRIVTMLRCGLTGCRFTGVHGRQCWLRTNVERERKIERNTSGVPLVK